MRLSILLLLLAPNISFAANPNIVLIMTDDQGWGQTSYNGHPVLQTPNLDAMSDNGLRFNRFYAAAPVCSPTRASVLTGRTNMRTGVESHGFALRKQEKTLSRALREHGYATGHFGKWHLNGMRGPGVPLLLEDTHHPGEFGFDRWLSVTNFFDRNPIMSRMGSFVDFEGDSSEIIVDESLKFISQQAALGKPSFTVIWFGTPHNPFRAAEDDVRAFDGLDSQSKQHYGELVAMDRSIGTFRKGLRDLEVADNTIVWFCSDNGGLPKIEPETVGGLRGNKGTMYEGGLRVPGIVEWPARIKPRITDFPAVVMDIFPTIAEIVSLPDDAALSLQDGISLLNIFDGGEKRRERDIPFQCFGNTAVIDNQYKLIEFGKTAQLELYDLSNDQQESHNLYASRPQLAQRMLAKLQAVKSSIAGSFAGKDYPEKKVLPENPKPRFWTDVKDYEPYFESWVKRPEYSSRLRKKRRP